MTDLTSPPALDTRDTPSPPSTEKRITSSRLHAPPVGTPASHSVAGSPPETSIFFSLPGAKKPMKRLSGDQKGKLAPSVPASGFASAALKARTQSCTLPPVVAVKASHFPSGDTAMWSKLVFSGGRMDNIITGASLVIGWRIEYAHANPNIPSNNAAETAHASRVRTNKRNGPAPTASSRAPDELDNTSSA